MHSSPARSLRFGVFARLLLRRAALLALACVIAPAAVAQRVNIAKFQPAAASAQNGSYAPDFATDGIVSNHHSHRTGNQTVPFWLEVSYARPVAVGSAHVYLGILDGATPAQILVNFRFQYHDGAAWVDVPGSFINSNTATERAVTFAQTVTATRFRLYSSDSGSRTIRELALFPPNLLGGVEQGFPLGTDVNLNLARQRPATASSTSLTNIYGPGYAKNAFDGLIDNASRWICSAAAGEYLEIDLLASHRVATAHVYSGFIDPADPTRTVTQPIPEFALQYFDAATSTWLTVPGGAVTGNTEVARLVEFTSPVTTSRIRLATTTAFNGRIQELLLFPPRPVGTPLGREVVNAPPSGVTWEFYSDSIYHLRNTGPDLRLGLLEGQVVQIAPTTANAPLMEWQLLLNHRDGSHRVRHVHTGFALALAEITHASDTAVVIEPYNGLPHQDWLLDFDPAAPDRFRLLNAYSGLVLQTRENSTAPGADMVVRLKVDGLDLQYWNANHQRHHPKKGIAGTSGRISTSSTPFTNDPNLTFHADYYHRLGGGSWSYGWGRQTSNAFPYIDADHTHNPMQWGNYNWTHGTTNTAAGPLERIYRDVQSNGKPVHLLGFNEPDKTEQANMSVAAAIARWPRLEAQDLPLVAPVPAAIRVDTSTNPVTPAAGWMADFVTQADALGYRRDFTAVHTYGPPNANNVINNLQRVYEAYGRPIWLTEFSVVDWSQNATWTHANNFNFLAEFLWRAESLPWLKRYSLFAFIQNAGGTGQGGPDPVGAPRSNSINADGSLTPFGQLYAGWDGVAAVLPDRAYHLHNHGLYQRVQNPGTGATPSSVTPDSTTPGQQWFLVPGGTARTHRILSARDGRPLRFVDGGGVTLGTPGETGAAVEWTYSAETNGHGRHYIQHPASANKHLRANSNGTFGMVAATNTSDADKWRFIRPAVPEPLDRYPIWSASRLWSDSSSAATTADPDADTLPNLLEYALATDPLVANQPGYVVSIGHSGAISITFVRLRTDLRYEVLASSDLADWTVIATDPGQIGEEIMVTDPAPGPRRFLRLRVTALE